MEGSHIIYMCIYKVKSIDYNAPQYTVFPFSIHVISYVLGTLFSVNLIHVCRSE
jgi:hypothetical protein